VYRTVLEGDVTEYLPIVYPSNISGA